MTLAQGQESTTTGASHNGRGATTRSGPSTTTGSRKQIQIETSIYNGDYGQFEEWQFKFTAFLGLQDPDFPRLLEASQAAQQELTESQLRSAATTIEEGEKHVRLSNDLKYILVSVTTGPAATVIRQFQRAIGFEMYRQLTVRFAIPTGPRSIGFLTKVIKPTLDPNNFEESFAAWEYDVSRYERDNNQQLPGAVKTAILLNETTGALQQHLQLQSGNNPTYAQIKRTIIEYYRTTTSFARATAAAAQSSAIGTNFGGGQAAMDIDALRKGKGKYNKGQNKGKNKGYNKGKGYGDYNKGYGHYGNKGKGKYNNKGKGKGYHNPIGYGNPFGGGKGFNNGNKGQHKGKERARTRANKQATHVTDVDNQATTPRTAELQSTTLMTIQHNNNIQRTLGGTTMTCMLTHGITKTLQCHSNSKHNWHYHHLCQQALVRDNKSQYTS